LLAKNYAHALQCVPMNTRKTSTDTLSTELAVLLKQNQFKITVAESCTGGLLAAAITAISGSSDYFDGGLITYSNEAKAEWLEVPQAALQQHGAVSEQTARAMVEGALHRSNGRAQVAVAITGIAGPTGGVAHKPVGTVCFAWKIAQHPVVLITQQFVGDRESVRAQATIFALKHLIELLRGCH
jgi:nicotinamide-nucleotide amidase